MPKRTRTQRSPKSCLFDSPSLFDVEGRHTEDYDESTEKENISPFTKKNKLSIDVPQSRHVHQRVSLLSNSENVLTPTRSPTRRTLCFDQSPSIVPSSASTDKEVSPMNDSFSDSPDFLVGLTLNSPSASPAICNMKFGFQSPVYTSPGASEPRRVVSFPSPTPSFTCKRIIREESTEDYYSASNKRMKQRHSHALFAKKKFSMTSNLVLPSGKDFEHDPSPVSGNFDITSISPVPINLEDMSPGIFCSPTVFDLPDSDKFAMKLPMEKEPRNRDCNTISPETMIDVLDGKFGDYIVVDCRFPYEYNGGHIKDAINVFEPDPLERFFVEQFDCPESPVSPQSPLFNVSERLRQILFKDSKNICIIFHCEFSQHRAPKMYRFLRELDRKVHEETYPELYYPNIYVLEGGYRGFFEHLAHRENVDKAKYCVPDNYIPMDDKDYQQELQANWKLMKCGWSKRKRKNKLRR